MQTTQHFSTIDANGYSRSSSIIRNKTSKLIADLYNCEYNEMVSSGINAIYITMFSLCQLYKHKDIVILISDELFSGTKQYIFNRIIPDISKVKIISFNVEDQVSFTKLINKNSNITAIFIESVSNPNGLMGTYFKKYVSDDIYIIYDNTFLTPFLFKIFQ